METGKENYKEQDTGFELTMFTIEDEDSFNPGENFKEEEEKEKLTSKEKEEDDDADGVEDTDDNSADNDTDDSEDNTDESENKEKEIEEPSSIDKIMAQLLDEGKLLLPDDYEYEDTEEGLKQAFEDSEKFRNQLAFQEAINYLTSKEGLDLIKVKESVLKIDSYESLDIEKLSEDDKLNVIKEFYKAKDYDDSDIEGILEDLIGNDIKIERELNVATKYLKKEEQKTIQKETEAIAKKREREEQDYKDSQNLLKNKLKESNGYKGYIINESNKDRIFNATYKPIKLPDGNITTEINKRLSDALNDPEKYMVLSDILLNDFDFSSMLKKEESKATEKVKKSIRDFKNSNTKSKVSGRNSQTQNDFDLSKASMSLI
jgi:hypothetical protein